MKKCFHNIITNEDFLLDEFSDEILIDELSDNDDWREWMII